MRDILKKINKKEKVIIGITIGVILIVLINVIVKDTHAFYSDKTEISLFNAKVGNFKPVLNSFYIKENNIQPKYTNQNINTVYLSWGNNNKNINEMCITEGDVNSCRWQVINTSTQYTFATETEGAKIVKGYIRDKVGNKSLEKSDTIIYDKTAPTINKVEATTTENSITISVTANQDTSGVDKYCYATSQAGPYTCKSENTNQYTGLEGGIEYEFWIYLKDKAGNGVQGNATQYKFKTKITKDYLKDKDAKNTLQDNVVDGMYRYYGTKEQVTNNYICFGTTDKEECLATPKTYMYRIIGITSTKDDTINIPANSLKIIKAIPSIESQQWHSGGYYDDIKWDASAVKAYLNDTFYNATFVTETTRIPNASYWDSLILSHSWYNTDYTKYPTTEPKTSHTSESKIGLMYVTDYGNAGPYDISSWLFITNGWSGNVLTDEWTMSRYGKETYRRYLAWNIDSNGNLNLDNGYLPYTHAVRPVFYVVPNITLTGEGSTESPFIIHS